MQGKNTFSYALANGLCASSDIQLLENAAVNEKLSFNKAFPGQCSPLFSAASSTSPPCPATEPGSGLAFVAGEGEVKSSPQSDRVVSSVLRPLSFSVDAQMIQHSVFNLL